MSKQANPFLIGVFVLGASALFIIGLVIFGSGSFFKEETHLVGFFEGSVKGLRVGARVTFRGVQIGEVTDVQIRLDRQDGSTLVPVFITIYPDKIVGDRDETVEEGEETLRRLIDRGLRAQLEMESFVTGLLAVNFDYFPDTEPVFVGAKSHLHEIPTVPSIIQRLSKAIEDFPIMEIGESLKNIVNRVDELLQSDDAEAMAGSFTELMEKLEKLVESADQFFVDLDSKIDPVSKEIKLTLQEARLTLDGIRTTVSSANGMFAEDSAGRVELQEMIISLRRAAERVGALAEYLERNPESLLRGKR